MTHLFNACNCIYIFCFFFQLYFCACVDETNYTAVLERLKTVLIIFYTLASALKFVYPEKKIVYVGTLRLWAWSE